MPARGQGYQAGDERLDRLHTGQNTRVRRDRREGVGTKYAGREPNTNHEGT